MLLAATRNWRWTQWAPISFNMASLQMFLTTRLVNFEALVRTFLNLNGSILNKEDLESSRCSKLVPFFLMHWSTLSRSRQP